jgi:hypothetical protein
MQELILSGEKSTGPHRSLKMYGIQFRTWKFRRRNSSVKLSRVLLLTIQEQGSKISRESPEKRTSSKSKW